MSSLAEWAFLAGAGLVAGTVGSAGAITSLIAYPALLVTGLRPFQANVTVSVAFVACLPGSALGSRSELAGQGAWLRRWGLIAMGGGLAGVALLLTTPRSAFVHLVPFLLILASVVLLLQPMIARIHRVGGRQILLPCGLFAVSVYDGYFGAGSGVMLLALLLFTVDRDFARLNAAKNVLLGMTDILCAISFAVFAPVRWADVVPMACGLFVGSMLGPAVTRIAPPALIRVLAAMAGVSLAVWLWINPS
jgi:uncharacterized protein